MDQTDLKLISLLEENARMPLKSLAEKVFLSSPATAARIKRLEEEGIITGYGVRVNRTRLGFPITAFIHLDLTPDQKSVFYPFVRACPSVLECSCITGRYSMLLKVAFPSTEELDTFINRLHNFGPTETQIVFSTVFEQRGIDPERAAESISPALEEIASPSETTEETF